MHETIKDHMTIDGIKQTLEEMAFKQGSRRAYCKLRFRYPWVQKALRTRMPLNAFEENNPDLHQVLRDGTKISTKKMEGHIAYNVTIEGRYVKGADNPFKFYLTTEYTYSSTCPCSFELARSATEKRDAAANAHSQRSIMTTTVQFNPSNIVWIEDLIELHRHYLPTEVQIIVKRRDEQAFAELNGSNLLFSEDAVRLMYGGLKGWIDEDKIQDFTISTSHEESLHPWNAIAVTWYDRDVANDSNE